MLPSVVLCSHFVFIGVGVDPVDHPPFNSRSRLKFIVADARTGNVFPCVAHMFRLFCMQYSIEIFANYWRISPSSWQRRWCRAQTMDNLRNRIRYLKCALHAALVGQI